MKQTNLLTKLLLLCLCVVGSVSGAWSEEYTSVNPKTVTYGGKTFVDVSNTTSNATVESSGENCLAYNVYYLQTLASTPAWFTPSGKGSSSSAVDFANPDKYGFLAKGSSSSDVSSNAKAYGNVSIYNLINGIFFLELLNED